MRSVTLQKYLDGLMTPGEVRQSFPRPISAMTLYLWRKRQGLPVVIIPGDRRSAVRFVEKDVAEWAKRRNLGFEPKRRSPGENR